MLSAHYPTLPSQAGRRVEEQKVRFKSQAPAIYTWHICKDRLPLDLPVSSWMFLSTAAFERTMTTPLNLLTIEDPVPSRHFQTFTEQKQFCRTTSQVFIMLELLFFYPCTSSMYQPRDALSTSSVISQTWKRFYLPDEKLHPLESSLHGYTLRLLQGVRGNGRLARSCPHKKP